MAHRLPSAPLQALLDEEEALGPWLSAAQHWPLAELRWALGPVKPQRLGEHLPTLLASHWFPSGAEAEARWQALTERLVAPLPAQAVAPGRVPAKLLPRWLALGLRPPAAEWSRWLREQSQVESLDALWPATAAHAPELERSALDGLLVPLLANPFGGVEDQTSLGGLQEREDTLLFAKLRWAQAHGLRPSRIGWLRADLEGTPSEAARFALAQGWVQRAPEALRRQVALLLQCDVRALSACLGLAPETLDGTEAPQAVDGFVQTHYAAARRQLLELLAHNDREGLKAFKAEGLVHIGGLPLPDRRQRAAWVLAQREPAALLSQDTLLQAVRAAEGTPAALSQRIDKALARGCPL